MKKSTELQQQDFQESFSNQRQGFRIDNFLICFPEGDIISEDENGMMAVNVDIFKLEKGNHIRIKQEELTEDLEIKISAYINEMLVQAIEEENKNVKN